MDFQLDPDNSEFEGRNKKQKHKDQDSYLSDDDDSSAMEG